MRPLPTAEIDEPVLDVGVDPLDAHALADVQAWRAAEAVACPML